MALRALSLCAGIGGIDLGFRGVARTVCYVEREAFCAAILRARMQDGSLDDAPIWSDLGTFDARAWRGAVDLVTAGYPCQPFSRAGKRLGEDDERHLWPHVRRIIDECGASLVFLENVPDHIHVGLADVLHDLAELGFDARWDCFSAATEGIPQRRTRLFVLADHHNGRLAPELQWNGARPNGALRTHCDGLVEAERRTTTLADRRDGGGDRVPHWLDRARAVGNAVVPQVAARAFAELAERLTP